jgi:ribosome-associated translation inhibitor RaiA
VKNLDDKPESVRNSVVILRCRDIDLTASDRTELHKSEVALGRVFRLIHRIEWKVTGRARSVEARCQIHARSGEFAADGEGTNARGAVQDATQRILKQKVRAKETLVTRRRTPESGTPSRRSS